MVAAIAQRSSGAGTVPDHVSGASSITTTALGSSVTAGSGLVVICWGFNSSLPTISTVRSNRDGTTNFTAAQAPIADAGSNYISCYYLPNTAGGASLTCTVTFSGSVSEIYAVAFECTGVATDSSFYNTSLRATGTSTNPSTGNLTAGANAQIAFSLFTDDTGAGGSITTNGTGWTTSADRTNGAVDVQSRVEHKASSTMGGTAVSNNWTLSVSAPAWQAQVLTFNIPGAASPQTVNPNAIATAESVFQPTVSLAGAAQTVNPNAIGTGVVLFAPVLVGLRMLPNAVASVEQVYPPTISVGALPGQVQPNAIPSAELVLGLTVGLRMLPGAIATGAVLYAPSVFVGAAGPFVTSVSTNGRYLQDQFSAPYFIQGNSPQSIIARLTTTEMETFFADQQARGINSSQIHLILGNSGGMGGNADGSDVAGHVPFSNMTTLAGPLEPYWSTVDQMFTLARAYGVTVWATCIDNISMGATAEGMTTGQHFTLGQFLGNRYKDRQNIVWTIGNDWQPGDWTARDAKYQQLVAGIASTGDTHLVTSWLNFYDSNSWDGPSVTWDSIHDVVLSYSYANPYQNVERAYADTSPGSPQPVFFGEGNYEGETLAGTDPATDERIRRTAWYPVTWGACGHFFGQHLVWNFAGGYLAQLNSTVAQQIAKVAALMPTLTGWQNLVPDTGHALITAGSGTHNTSASDYNWMSNDFATAAVTTDRRLAVVYVPTVRSWTITTSAMAGTVTGFWYDPTTGVQTTATAPWTIPATAHSDGAHDWVLVLQGSGTVTVLPDPIATAAVVYGPTVGAVQTLLPATIATGAAVPNPTVSLGLLAQTVFADSILTAEQVPLPTVTMGAVAGVVQPGLILTAEQVYAPTLKLQMVPGAIVTAEVVYAPTVLRAVSQSVTPDTIATAAMVYDAAFLGYTMAPVFPDGIGSRDYVYGPSVGFLPAPPPPSLILPAPAGAPALGSVPRSGAPPLRLGP